MKNRVVRHAVQQPLDASYRLIPLTQGQNAIVDECDYDWLTQWNWNAARYGSLLYAHRGQFENGKVKTIRMHRVILGGCLPIDHVNGNGLDNRRVNIRHCKKSDNSHNQSKRIHNTSGYKGVIKKRHRWQAMIGHARKRIHLGTFDSAEAAARKYDEYAVIFHGLFARLNFPI